MGELVTDTVVCCAVRKFVAHHPNYDSSGRYEENFHASVVDADEVHEEVDVSDTEYDKVDLLGLARYA